MVHLKIHMIPEYLHYSPLFLIHVISAWKAGNRYSSLYCYFVALHYNLQVFKFFFFNLINEAHTQAGSARPAWSCFLLILWNLSIKHNI